jgi:hypothetical protein
LSSTLHRFSLLSPLRPPASLRTRTSLQGRPVERLARGIEEHAQVLLVEVFGGKGGGRVVEAAPPWKPALGWRTCTLRSPER